MYTTRSAPLDANNCAWDCGRGYERAPPQSAGSAFPSPEAEVCRPCAPGSFRGPGQVACAACPFPAHSAAPGAVACTGCAEGYYLTGFQPAGHALCRRCAMPNTTTASVLAVRWRSTFADACRCKAGFHGCSWSCRPCPPGTYKKAVSYTPDSGPCDQQSAANDTDDAVIKWGPHPADRCVLCGAGLFSPTAAATSESACLPCPTPTVPSLDHSECQCPTGSYLNATIAIGGGRGHLLCPLCPPGTYSQLTGLTAASECDACAENASSPAGSTDSAVCECNAGYAGIGAVECEQCPANYSSVPGGPPGSGADARCVECPVASTAPPASGRCMCVHGTYAAWGPAAEWDLMAGPTLWCLQCPSNSYSAFDRYCCWLRELLAQCLGGEGAD